MTGTRNWNPCKGIAVPLLQLHKVKATLWGILDMFIDVPDHQQSNSTPTSLVKYRESEQISALIDT